MNDMVVRKMTYPDLEEAYQIEKDSFSSPWTFELMKNEMDHVFASYYVAETGGEILGFGGIYIVLDEATIVNLAVKREVRRSGIAKKLMNILIDECTTKNVKHIFLEVREKNEAAILLYDRFGFEVIEKRKNYYNDPVDHALIMRKLLM